MSLNSRLTWDDLPDAVKSDVQERLGAEVIRSETQLGGFSSGVASIIYMSDGASYFLKATPSSSSSASMYEDEILIARALPPETPAPRLLFSQREHSWIVLCFQAIEGHQPEIPWRDTDLFLVIAAIDRVAMSLARSPIPVNTLAEKYRDEFGIWRLLLSTGKANLLEHKHLPGDASRMVETLANLEHDWKKDSVGNALVHNDVRSDNLLIDSSNNVWFLDWPHASLGANWVDLVSFLPTIGRGGRELEAIWKQSSLSQNLPESICDSWLAAIAGMWIERSTQPDLAHVTGLREQQRRCALAALDWLQHRGHSLGLSS